MTTPQFISQFFNWRIFRTLHMFSYYTRGCCKQSRTCLLLYLCISFSQVLPGSSISGLQWSCYGIMILWVYLLHFLLYHLLFITMNKRKFYSNGTTTSVSPFSPNILLIMPTLKLRAPIPTSKGLWRKNHSPTSKYKINRNRKAVSVKLELSQ